MDRRGAGFKGWAGGRAGRRGKLYEGRVHDDGDDDDDDDETAEKRRKDRETTVDDS